jgi:gamma-glutamylcyclotransferase (GGCT)/AIG2-like uncharacterized protein YtfP
MIRHSCSDTPMLFRLFVYGTLKRGYWNHDTYCRSAVSVEEATVRGRLYELPSAIPVMLVPDDDILAVGSDCVLDDILRQDTTATPGDDWLADGWDEVHGELITFTDLAAVEDIDRLEGFRPGRPCLYRRVLVPVTTVGAAAQPAWCYVLGVPSSRTIIPLGKDSWPR